MKRESFVFYKDWKEAISGLPDEIRLEVYEGIIEYALSGKQPQLKTLATVAFNFIKPQIDRNNKRYENGKKGGAPPGNKNANKNNQKTTKNNQKQPNENVNVNVNVNDISPYNPPEGDSEVSFEKFWMLYDKKVGSREKLRKKWNKLPRADKLAIFEYIPRYIAANPEKKFRKNPETFLNNQSWNDEIIADTKADKNEPERREYTIHPALQ